MIIGVLGHKAKKINRIGDTLAHKDRMEEGTEGGQDHKEKREEVGRTDVGDLDHKDRIIGVGLAPRGKMCTIGEALGQQLTEEGDNREAGVEIVLVRTKNIVVGGDQVPKEKMYMARQ